MCILYVPHVTVTVIKDITGLICETKTWNCDTACNVQYS